MKMYIRTVMAGLILISNLLLVEGNALVATTSPSTQFAPTNPKIVNILTLSRKEGRVYTFTIPSNASWLRVTTTASSGDIDIYLRKSLVPSQKKYTWKSNGDYADESIFATKPTAGLYYLYLYPFTRASNVLLTMRYGFGTTTPPVVATSTVSVPAPTTSTICATDVYICPNGVSVGRSGVNCTFTCSSTQISSGVSSPLVPAPVPAPSPVYSGGGGGGSVSYVPTPAPTTPSPVAPTPSPVVTPPATPSPTVTISASQTSIAYNATTNITWSSANATACTLSNGKTGTSGSFTTSALTTNTTYTVSCTGAGGSVSGSVTVIVAAPVVVPTPATPSPVNGVCGTSHNQTLSSVPATNLCATGTSSTVAGSGPWTWSCIGSNGGTTASCTAAKVVVAPSPTVTISASQTSIAYNATTNITWSSTNTTACTLTNGKIGTSGSFVTPALTTSTTYSISCTGVGGSVSGSVAVTVAAAPTNKIPTVSIILPASAVTVTQGSSVQFTGSAADTDGTITSYEWRDGSCTAGTFLSSASSFTNTTLSTGSHTIYFRAQDNSGAWSTDCKSRVVMVNAPVVTPLPTVTITAANTSINANSATTISWFSTNAASCSSNTSAGGTGTSGSFSTGNISVPTIYTVTCTGAGGTNSASVTVGVTTAPVATTITTPLATSNTTNASYSYGYTYTGTAPSYFHMYLDTDANATTGYSIGGIGADYLIENGYILRYTGTNGAWLFSYIKNVTYSNTGTNVSWTIARTDIGTPSTVKLVGDFVLANSLSGVVTQTFGSTPLPTVTITAANTSINANSATTISWFSTNAASCSSNTSAGGTGTSGSFSTGNISVPTIYTVTCTGAGGTNSASVTVGVTTAPVALSIPQQIISDYGKSDAKAHGVESWPISFSGMNTIVGGYRQENVFPDGWTSGTSWGQIYRDFSDAQDTNTRVAIRDLVTYVFNKATNSWELVQSDPVGGASFVENFSGNLNSPIDMRTEADGSISVKLVHGYNFHFWPQSRIASIDRNTFGGFYTVFKARKVLDNASGVDDRSTAKYLMSVGGDWWRSTTAPALAYGVNGIEIGYSREKYVTNDWQTIRFSSMLDADLILHSPPQ